MGNTNAQINRLYYASRADFETATSAITGLSVCGFITGEDSQVLGVKNADDSYEYIVDQTEALAALAAIVTTNTDNIADLAGQVAANVPGTINLGSVYAPYARQFDPITAEATEIPLLFSEYNVDTMTSVAHIRQLWIRTDIVQSEVALSGTGNPQLVLTDAGGGNVLVTLNGESSTIGSVTVAGGVPGAYAIEGAISGDTLGYFTTDQDGLNSADLIDLVVARVSPQFSFNTSILGTADTPKNGRSALWAFTSSFLVNWVDGVSLDINAYIAGTGFGTAVTFALNEETFGDKNCKLYTEIQYLGYVDDGGGDIFHDFRAVITAEGSDDIFADTDRVKSIEVRIPAASLPSQCWFSLTAKPTSSGTPVATFALLQTTGLYTPGQIG